MILAGCMTGGGGDHERSDGRAGVRYLLGKHGDLSLESQKLCEDRHTAAFVIPAFLAVRWEAETMGTGREASLASTAANVKRFCLKQS